jgi:glycerol-3-phosphate acyltransferase PlsY
LTDGQPHLSETSISTQRNEQENIMNGIGTWNLVSYLIDKLGVGGTPAATAVTMGGILLCIIIPYLLGSLNFGVIISRKQYRDDVRTHGSGNAGATNMLRTFGLKAAILTMAGDMLKAVIAVGLGYLIVGVNAQVTDVNGVSYRMVDQFGAAIAGLFVMLGHIFPIFFKFKGGKGVATSGMVILMLSPVTAAVCLIVFLIVVIGTRYVSLGSVMALSLFPIVLNAWSHAYDPPRNPTACMISVVMAVLVVFMHRENLKRLANRTESKISFKKKKDEGEATER